MPGTRTPLQGEVRPNFLSLRAPGVRGRSRHFGSPLPPEWWTFQRDPVSTPADARRMEEVAALLTRAHGRGRVLRLQARADRSRPERDRAASDPWLRPSLGLEGPAATERRALPSSRPVQGARSPSLRISKRARTYRGGGPVPLANRSSTSRRSRGDCAESRDFRSLRQTISPRLEDAPNRAWGDSCRAGWQDIYGDARHVPPT
jgi:hypothetical protein